jgi:hypothetical protein
VAGDLTAERPVWTLKLLNAVQIALKGGCEVEELADLTGRPVEDLQRAIGLLKDHQPAAAVARLNVAAAPKAAPAAPAPASRILVPPPPFLNACKPIRRAPKTPSRIAPPPPPPTTALKPVTARVARWAWWFAAAGWAMDEVATLFDRDPEALTQAVEALA